MLVGAVLVGATLAPRPAQALDWHLRLEPGLAALISEP